MRSIKTLCREAYMNRYTFDFVHITKDGRICGHFVDRNGQRMPASKLGNIADCRAVQTPTGVRFYNRDFLVYTFGPED